MTRQFVFFHAAFGDVGYETSQVRMNDLIAVSDEADRFIGGIMEHDEMRLLTMSRSVFPFSFHYC
jgi:hypothetical protein